MRALLAAFLVLGAALPAQALNKCHVQPVATEASLLALDYKDCTVGYALDTDRTYVRADNSWNEVPGNIRVFDTFAEGDGKGLTTMQEDFTAAALTTGTHNLGYTGNGNRFGYAALGAGQTLDIDMDAGGLDVGGDQADDEGYEIYGAAGGASGRPFIIGTDPAFFFCATIAIGDVSGTDDFQVGFRKFAIVNAAFDDYTDAATFAINASANPAAVKLETILNNAGTTSTDTTDTVADDASKKYCINVSSAGVVTYTNDGSAPTTTAAFTFDDGDMVLPFARFLNTAAFADDVTIAEWEVGYQ